MKEWRCSICQLVKSSYCFNFSSEVCNECLQIKKEDENVKESATEIYRKLSTQKGALIPSDQVLSKTWGMTNGAPAEARSNLIKEGYEYRLNKDENWEVVETPGSKVTHYQATSNGIYKIYHERVESLPKTVSLRKISNSANKWEELNKLIEGMEVGEVQRCHFGDFLVAKQAQGATYKYCKLNKRPFTVSTNLQPNVKGASEYWLYFTKVAKNIDEWGKGVRAGTHNKK